MPRSKTKKRKDYRKKSKIRRKSNRRRTYRRRNTTRKRDKIIKGGVTEIVSNAPPENIKTVGTSLRQERKVDGQTVTTITQGRATSTSVDSESIDKIRNMLWKIHNIYPRHRLMEENSLTSGSQYTEVEVPFIYKDIIYKCSFIVRRSRRGNLFFVYIEEFSRISQKKFPNWGCADSTLSAHPQLSDEDNTSEPGDGALFVAAVVLYVNIYHPQPNNWTTTPASPWWRNKDNVCCGVDDNCSTDVPWHDACEGLGDHNYKIDNNKFKLWAENLLKKNGIVDPDTFIEDLILINL